MAQLRPTRNRYVTRVYGSYANGTYRQQYVQRIPLYTTLENLPNIITVGAGTVEVLGYNPSLGQQENTEYAVLRTVTLQRRSIGSGVYRRDQYRKLAKVIPFQRIAPDKTIRPGAAEVEVLGYQPNLDPRQLFTGAGVVEVNGKGPSVTADGAPVKSLSDALLMTMQAALRRRKLLKGFDELLRRPVYRADFIELTRKNPSRIIGIGSATVTVTTGQVTLQKVVAVGAGEVEVETYQIQYNPVGDAGEVLVEGYQVTLQVGFDIPVGSGEVEILGYEAATNSGAIGIGAGTVEIIGYVPGYALPEKQADPGVGEVTLEGAAPTIIATGGWDKTSKRETNWGQLTKNSDTWTKVTRRGRNWTKI